VTGLPANLDNVLVDTCEQRLFLIWFADAMVAGGPHDVTAIAVVPRE